MKFMKLREPFKNHIEKLNYHSLAKNPNGVYLISQNLDKLIQPTKLFKSLCHNPNAFEYIEYMLNNPKLYPNLIHVIDWNGIIKNPRSIKLVDKFAEYLSGIDWEDICKYSFKYNEWLDLLEKYKSQLNNECLCILQQNPKAINVIESMLYDSNCVIFLNELCDNPNGINLVEKYFDKIDINCWYNLCLNPNAIKLVDKTLEQNINNIDFWNNLIKVKQ